MSPNNYVHYCVSNSVRGIQLHLHVAEVCSTDCTGNTQRYWALGFVLFTHKLLVPATNLWDSTWDIAKLPFGGSYLKGSAKWPFLGYSLYDIPDTASAYCENKTLVFYSEQPANLEIVEDTENLSVGL